MADEVRYGIIGSGMMGIEHMLNLAAVDGAVVTAIADPEPASREMALAFAGPSAPSPAGTDIVEFDHHADLLASGRCDAVVVATPNMTHVDVLLDVLGAGVDVLVEKPLCTTVADCRRVIEAAEGHPGVVWVGLEYRYMPPVARFIEHVHDGDIGRVRMLAIREHRFPFLPKVGDWNRFNRNTGGTLVEKCCHFFDLMAHVVGSRPVRVLASGGQDVNHLDERYAGEVPDILDNAFVIVDFDDGARALLDLCMFAEGSEHQEELSAVGDTGKVEAFLPQSTVRLGRRSGGRPGVRIEEVRDDRVRYEGFHHGSSYLEHVDFLAAVRAGAPAGVSLADGLWSVAMGVAGQRSIEQGRPVTLDEVLGE
jgi:myo-inositol 2-dehydrogenase / D-chiro-inositol 1-dehydrogenase